MAVHDPKAEIIVTGCLVVALLIGAVVWDKVSGYVSCQSYASQTERTVKYSAITGCYVKTDVGAWVPREEMTKTAVVQGSK